MINFESFENNSPDEEEVDLEGINQVAEDLYQTYVEKLAERALDSDEDIDFYLEQSLGDHVYFIDEERPGELVREKFDKMVENNLTNDYFAKIRELQATEKNNDKKVA